MTSRRLIVLAVLAAALVGVGALLFLGRTSPEAVDLDRAAAAVTGGVGPDTPATSPSEGGTAVAGTDITDATGTWRVDTERVTFDAATGDGSWVGYRIDEELAGRGAFTAVGRTPAVTGAITIEGTRVMSAEVTAVLTGLISDDSSRDSRIRSVFAGRDATFELLAPVAFAEVPVQGQRVVLIATGLLTIGDISREVEVELAATAVGDVLVVTGSMDVVLADFDVRVPSVPIVLSVADVAAVELQLYLVRD